MGAQFVARKILAGILVALGVVIILLLTAIIGAMCFFGSVAVAQLNEVAQQAPAGLKMLIGRLQEHPYGRYALPSAATLLATERISTLPRRSCTVTLSI